MRSGAAERKPGKGAALGVKCLRARADVPAAQKARQAWRFPQKQCPGCGAGLGAGGGARLPPKEGACVGLSVPRLAPGLPAWAATWALRMTTCASSANRPHWSLVPSPSPLGAALTPCLLSLHVTAGCHRLQLPLDGETVLVPGSPHAFASWYFSGSHLPPPPSNSRSPGEGAPTGPCSLTSSHQPTLETPWGVAPEADKPHGTLLQGQEEPSCQSLNLKSGESFGFSSQEPAPLKWASGPRSEGSFNTLGTVETAQLTSHGILPP